MFSAACSFPLFRSAGRRLITVVVLLLVLLVAFETGDRALAQCSGGSTTTFNSSGGVSVSAGTISTSTNTITVDLPEGTIVTCVSVVLNGVTSNGSGTAPNGDGYASMENAYFMLTGPGGQQVEFLGATGDGTDGNDNPTSSGAGLSGVNITVADNASGVAPEAGVAIWPHTGPVTVKPSSYSNSPNVTEGNPPLGNSSQWAQTDGTATFTKQFVTAEAVANGNWKLSLTDNDPFTGGDPVSVTSWTLVLTTEETSNASTTTSLSSSSTNNTSFTSGANSSVTLTATVTSTSTVSTGTVQFTDGGNTIAGCGAQPVSNGHATCTTTFTTEGIHTIGAAYSGATGFSESSFSGLEQFVKNHSTLSNGNYCNPGAIADNASNPNPYPSIVNVGTDTAALTGTVADLTVTLNGLAASTGLGPDYGFLLVAPDASKAYNLVFLADAGDSASQPATDVSFADDHSSAPQDGALTATTYEATALDTHAYTWPASTSPAPSLPGAINYAQPDVFGTNPLTLTQAFEGANGNGDWKLYAYNDTGEPMSVSSWCVAFTVNNGAITTTTLGSSSNPGVAGNPVTLTATVTSGGSPVTSGTVTFTENGAAPAGVTNNTVTLNGNGLASITTSSLSEGDHNITATYNGVADTYDPGTTTLWQRIDHASTVSGSNPYLICNPGGITLPAPSETAADYGAASPNPSNIFVSNLPGTINSVSVELENFQTNPTSDTILWTSSLLVGPGATAANSLNFFSGTGSTSNDTLLSKGNYTFSDSASELVPQADFGPGSYKPTSYGPASGVTELSSTFTPSPSGFYTLPGSWDFAGPAGTSTLSSLYDDTNANGIWSLYFYQNTSASSPATAQAWCLSLTENLPTASVDLSSASTFTHGQQGSFTVSITNNGPGSTGDPSGSQPMTVTDVLNSAFTYSSFSGAGWSCSASGQTVTCTNDSAVTAANSYPQLTINVNVTGSGNVSNTVSTAGAGTAPVTSNIDTVTIDIAPAITSASSTTFTVGSSGFFTVTTTGTPTPTLTMSGALPTGLTFTDNGNGTATLAGTPAANMGGVYSLSITAGNGATPNATQSFTLTVDQPPSITSANSTTFTVGAAGSFTLSTAAGTYPSVTFSESGALPSGVTLSSSGALSGIPAAGTGGTYRIIVSAANGVSPNAVQDFTLTVDQAPAITSTNNTSFTWEASNLFTVTATGTPTPSLSESGALPNGVTFTDNGNGTATLAGTPTAYGTYLITITANNGVGSPAQQSFTLTVPVPQFVLTTSANPAVGGTVTPSSGGSYTIGAIVPIAAIPNTGYYFVNWTSSPDAVASPTSASTTISMNAAESVTANFGVNLVVTTAADDNPSSASNCTPQATPGSNTTDLSCSLRDALAFAGNTSAANITFASASGQLFSSAQTIALLSAAGTFNIPANTTITGPSSGSGYTLANLVTVNGGGATGVFNVAGVTAVAAISNLNIVNGNASSGGGINNNGTLTVSNCSFSGNIAPYGAAIESSGKLTVTNSTFSSNSGYPSNSAPNGVGGAIQGVLSPLTVSYSTFSGNSAVVGGAIDTNGALTITNSTFSGNGAPGATAGAIYANGGPLVIGNNIFAGNTSTTAAVDNNGAGLSDNGNNVFYNNAGGDTNFSTASSDVTGSNPMLAPLGNYGGPTPTMIPLPGSAAICAAASANLPPGVTVDQRGLPDINSTYTSKTPCVDAGAVQTNYAMSFTTEPPASAYVNQPLTPAPAVTLTESGQLAKFATSTVSMTDTAGDLAGTTTGSIVAGVATFGSLDITAATSDALIATLQLTPAPIALSVQSSGITVTQEPPMAAKLVLPVPGSTLTGSNVTFVWTGGYEVKEYQLYVGTIGVGSNNLYDSGATTETSKTVTLPTNGETLFVRLYQLINDIWQPSDYTYTAFGTPIPAAITSPPNGSKLTSSSVTFEWAGSNIATRYQLLVGTTGKGSSELYDSGTTMVTAATVTLPTNGETLYVRLYQLIDDIWQPSDYTYTAYGMPIPAAITSPPNGSTLTGASVTFEWTGSNVTPTNYELLVGTTGAGSNNLFNSGGTEATSETVAVPTTGATLYVRLRQLIDGTWQSSDYTYKESGAPILAAITSPPNASTLTGSSVTFEWAGSNVATEYELYVGTIGTGSGNVYSSGQTQVTSAVVTVPAGGAMLFVQLRQLVGGTWQSANYTYTESGPLVKATMNLPVPGTTLTGNSATFDWSGTVSPAEYQLYVGTIGKGSNNLYDSGATTETMKTVTLPTNGKTLYVSLYQLINGMWQSSDYVYTEAQ
jgi:hypothetical protein